MTIEEMRRAMREKVVPEEVVPQNVVNCLIDEDAEPPKLDAFAFLMRLRTLGIGSADFLNLLEGCGAPESVVNKIKQNPAMNLQGLVLTLESSELTTEDYTRMLLTARQVWERTLTLRLEKSEKISRDMEFETEETPEELPESSDELNAETEEPEAEDADNAEDDDFYYDEDLQEMSFTAVFNKINEEIREGVLKAEAPAAAPDEVSGDGEAAEVSAEVPEPSEEQPAEDADADSDSFAAAFDKIKSAKKLADTGVIGETSSLVEINEDELKDSLGEEEVSEETEEDETDGDTDDNDEEIDDERPARVYHKGAIIGGAVGAAVLVGAGFFIGQYAAGKNTRSFHYAEDTVEIFNKIYHAYSDEEQPVPGGDKAYAPESGDYREIFGDLLIGGGEDNKSFASFSENGITYTLSEETISVSKTENGTVTPLEALVPPEKARFVAAFDENGKLYAMFSGKQSGFMKISGGKAELTVRQDGALTDYDMSDGKMRLGTVYTPSFGHTFEIADEDMYLPRTGTELKPISAQDVIMSETKGYSYGVSAEYSAENGELQDVCAVIGDPVAASADGRFALNGENGILLKENDGKFSVENTDKLSRAAFYKNGCAVIGETSEDGSVPDIKLFNTEFKHTANLTGLSEKVSGMWFDGGVLAVKCGSGSPIYTDCSDPGAPRLLSLKSADGVVMGNSALTFAVTDKALVITRYDLENGAAKKLAEYSKSLPAEQLADAKFGGAETAVANETQSGASYSYFDGVSVVSGYVAFENGTRTSTDQSVFDDKTGFTAAFVDGGVIKAVCAEGVKTIQLQH